jgi:adenylate kinase family enzyme
MIETYYIGGSPCSGKSTIAKILAEKYNLTYFKVDDYLDEYTKKGALQGYNICKNQLKMNAEQLWMREPLLQCQEEFLFYEEIFEYILSDLKKITNNSAIITEGAAYLPTLIKKFNISKDRFFSVVPTREFQIFHYKQRAWVPHALSGCKNKEKAFLNWMERDALFALEVNQQCAEIGFSSITNDGNVEIETLACILSQHFGLR